VKRALLQRFAQDLYMTGGNLVDAASGEEIAVTMELPSRNNARNVSDIPAGTYRCNYRFSESHNADKYHIDGVPGRDGIEIHTANWPEQIKGCVGLGTLISGRSTAAAESEIQRKLTRSSWRGLAAKTSSS
jgi:hypothetical protein